MRKALMAGAAVVVVAAAWLAAPTVWSQNRGEDGTRERRVIRLDGRGSAIGVSIRDLDAAEAAKAKVSPVGGVVIEEVAEDGPGAKAGLRRGDVVVEFDGERVRGARHFTRLVQETPEGRTVRATVVRDGGRQTLEVTPDARRFADTFVLPEIADDIEREVERGLRALPRDFAFDFSWDGRGAMTWPRGRLGAEVTPLTDQLAAYFGVSDGVLVSAVDADSVAAKAGLAAGDVITAINGRAVRSSRDIAAELRAADAGSEVAIEIVRGKQPMTLKAPLPERRRPRYVRPAD